jgi:cysteine-rich repeat protein
MTRTCLSTTLLVATALGLPACGAASTPLDEGMADTSSDDSTAGGTGAETAMTTETGDGDGVGDGDGDGDAGFCGDGVLDEGEACDDGELNSDTVADACRTNCVLPGCGDGIKVEGEECDFGFGFTNDGCSDSCTIETPVNFDCAIESQAVQEAAAPDYWYASGNGDVAPTAARQPFQRTWEPVLEETPACNGLDWSWAAVDRELKEFSFLVVLDASWVNYYAAQEQHFATQGYPTLEASAEILFDRVSYLYERQFGVRISISRVESFPGLTEKCASNNNHVENGDLDSSNTWFALENAGVTMAADEAGIVRLGVGSETVYCHSSAPLSGVCSESLLTNQRAPFSGDTGRLNHRAAVTLAHELGHFFGICSSGSSPHCLNNHLTNEIPDIMVWDGTPATNARPEGMFFKFMNACTPLYDEVLCTAVKAAPATCGVALTCENGGVDCDTTYWSTAGSRAALTTVPREVRARGDQLGVRCCGGTAPGGCASADLGGLATLDGDFECSGPMTWPDADRFCRQAGMRLCTADELDVDDLCAGTGCGYDESRVWTGTPEG